MTNLGRTKERLVSSGHAVCILWHGTTRQRAEAILRNGLDPNFREPGGVETAEGFSAAFPEGPFAVGAPKGYAAKKASLFPSEGGPAILEIEVPIDMIALADRFGGDVCFLPNCGLDELLQAWPNLTKRIVP